MNSPENHTILRSALRLLKWFCPDHLYEEIEGDLIQKFHRDVKGFDEASAKRRLVWNVIRFFRPGIVMRNRFSFELNQGYMLQSYFKFAYRHLMKSKVFSLLNVTGLAVGLASAFLIIQYLDFELGYDQFHRNKNEIFRVSTDQYENGNLINSTAGTFYGAGAFMKENFPEVENVTRFYRWPANTGIVFMAGNTIYNERNYLFAEPDFFKVFPSMLLKGDPGKCLTDPRSIIMSKRLAEKLFGTSDAIGKTVFGLDRQKQIFTVTAIMNNLPANSHFDADLILRYEKDWVPAEPWKYLGELTYVTIREGTPMTEFEVRVNTALKKNQLSNPDFKDAHVTLQPVTDIHLYPHAKGFYLHANGELKGSGDIRLVYALGTAFLVILLMAWINYVNLETSRYIARLKEVSIRRIVGSSKFQLIIQFLVQYFIICVLSFFLAAVTMYLLLPYYPVLTGIPLDSVTVSMPRLWIWASVYVGAGILLAGIYPAIVLINFNPVATLKGKVGEIPGGGFLRRSLLTFQFVSSLVLLAFLLVINRQLDFMRVTNKNMSLDRVLNIYNPTNYSAYEDSLRKEKNEVFRNNLLQNPAIANLSTSSVIPGEPIGFTYVDLAKRSLGDPDRQIPYKVVYIDYDFIPVFGLKLKAGRNFIDASGEDRNFGSLIVTESTIRELGFLSVEDAIDKEIYFQEDKWDKWKIIGIVEDYRHESVKTPVYPTIFRLHRNKGQMVYYSVLLSPDTNVDEAVRLVEKTWKEVWPEKSFDYFFGDQHYDLQYKSEIHFGRVFSIFAGVAMFISFLGILGMTLFETQTRLKEISIRKVLGATVTNLVALLSRRYFTISLFATVIALPLTYWAASQWLANYPVRIQFSPWFFAIPVVALVFVVFMASVLQTIRAANANPVDNLKYE